MINEHLKFSISKLKNNKKKYFRRPMLVTGIISISLIVPILVGSQLLKTSSVAGSGGVVSSIKPALLLSKSRKASNKKPVAPAPAPITTPVVTPAPVAAPAPVATPAPVTTPTPVVTTTAGGFGIAAGGGLMDLSQTQLDQYFASLNALGVKWVRWDMDWSIVQAGGQTSFDWSGADRVQQDATSHGINSLAIIDYAPKWASASGCVSGNECAPADPTTFAQFASAAATRYNGSISNWEIWNEPNITPFWSPTPDATKYGTLLKDAYLAIKQVNPSAIVISGGLSPADDVTGGDISPITFVQTLYTAGNNKYFDALAIHPYSFPVEPQYSATWNTWQQMNVIRQYMVAQGDANKKIWVTEYGAPTGGAGAAFGVNQLTYNYDASDFMSETAQATMMQDVVTLYNQNSSWMGPMFWYSLKDNGSAETTIENFFGLLRYDGSQKPAYAIFKSANAALYASL